ncbi:helix-turn-helix domain-containing protein [Chitinophaga sp. RAB17]|uniref:helix-turn-helix domain-containing protein n=1 Tax=Chitinophaga sp. RAB17 TaxID=3233049 RepID=UPI003F923041
MKHKKLQREIKTLAPEVFKKLHIISETVDLSKSMGWDDFFIHDLSSKELQLKYPLPPHRKIVNDLIYIHKGATVRKSNTDLLVSEANMLTIVPALTITETLSMDEQAEGYYLHFSDKFIMSSGLGVKDLVRLKSTWPALLSLDNAHAKIIYRMLQRIAYLYQKKKQDDLIRLYLLTLFKEIEMYSLQNSTVLKNKPDITVEKFKTLVSKNLYEHRSVTYYASLLHITPNHLNKLIKKNTGMPAISLINQMIILEIKVLLLQTDLSVSEIAFGMNFSDVSYFSKFFSKHTHTNPSAFRKMIEAYKS